MNRRARRSTLLAYAALAVLLCATGLLLSFITLYSDDYAYAQYFRGGLADFLAKTATHYREINGRALVHALDEVFLLGGTRVYALLFPFMLAGGLMLGYAAQAESDGRRVRWASAALGAAGAMALILALPVEFLNQTLCWVTGSFNYCFPVLLIAAYLFLLQRAVAEPGCLRLLALAPVALAAGAMTEQTGCVAVLGSLLLPTLARCRRPVLWAMPALSLVGYLSVMLAPGTAARVAADAGSGSLTLLLDPTALYARFGAVARFLFGEEGAMPIVAALLAALGMLGLTRRGLHQALLAGPIVLAAHLSLTAAGYATLGALAVCLYLLFAAILLLCERRLAMTGILLLGGLLSAGVMLFTALDAHRTMVPALLFFILALVRVAALLLGRLTATSARGICAVLILLCCVILAWPTYRGYAQNHAVSVRNDAAIVEGRELGRIELCTDYTYPYYHTLMLHSTYFYTQFRQYHAIADDCTVTLRGRDYIPYPIVLDGTRMRPTEKPSAGYAYDYGGILYLPFKETIEASGAVLRFVPGEDYTIERDGVRYRYRIGSGVITDADGCAVVEQCHLLQVTDRYYMAMDALCAFLGLVAEIDGGTLVLRSAT